MKIFVHEELKAFFYMNVVGYPELFMYVCIMLI